MTEISHAAPVSPDIAGFSRVRSRRTLKRAVISLALISGVAFATGYGWRYWTVGQYLQSTDDAYVKADYTTIAPKISGYIADVLVGDNQQVTAGQVLAHIDDRDYRTALEQAKAEVEAAEAAIRNLDAQTVLQRSVIEQRQADIAAAEATLKFAAEDHVRYRDLMNSGYGSVQRAQQADAALREQTAQLQRARAGLVSAQNRIEVLATERGKAEAERDRSRATLHQAELNLSYATITAPVSGTVGARSLRVGQFVQAGTQLMAVVPLDAAYVVGNFKETQLAHVRGGEPVAITVDGLPGLIFTGHVDSIAPASGLEFALLPPDNATGNFTKIVQRIPVRISLDQGGAVGCCVPACRWSR